MSNVTTQSKDSVTGKVSEDKSTNGAKHVVVKEDNTHPEYVAVDSGSVTLEASGVGANLIVQRTSPNGRLVFKITGTGTETITLTSILEDDQASGIESDGLLCKDVSTNANHGVVAITDDGTYIIPENIPGYFWKWTKSATTDTPTITYMSAL